MSPDLDVAVIGAGIAGLTTAHELRRAGLEVRVFEERPYVGGRMHSFRHDGYTIDEGAEQISARGYRATWELLARLGVTAAEVPRIGRAIGVWRDGRAHPGVADPSAVLTGAGLSPRARADLARLLAWTARHRRPLGSEHPEHSPAGDRTLARFARRYHRDLHDYLLQPVASCFFGWDTTRSAAAPLLGLLHSVGPVSTWRTYHDGMDLLARRLAGDLDVATARPVREVVTEGDRVRLRTAGGTVTARAAVLCVPAPVAARLHVTAPEDEHAHLTACTFTPTLKVSCLLDRPLAPASSTALYALLTPDAEDDTLSGILVDHAKHPGRAPAGKGLLTLMADPRRIPGLRGASERETTDLLVGAATRYVPGLREAARRHFVHRFTHGLPEVTPEALRGRASFQARPARPVEYAGDWVLLRPASEAAVRSGALAASRVLSRLRPAPTTVRTARPAVPAPRSEVRETA
ncbi:protoporphyrinogen/coproporphyrinogen oxidase [Streptomyces griseoaurantiacus]|uniref:Oxygen-dependent protoporphyrinogen oxidase n=1 Tax=Streptomyces griseoaurantiacus TaxID=68213 RepID=A0A1G7MEN6_9ACTN|nr:NAD(P)/FAD-dependent oxidoreductase [Streptomyces jietaisiensis]SDF60054.1 oxygen-dependent protoporphyrinogen oxidase [Streptomyces jietaisiensis]